MGFRVFLQCSQYDLPNRMDLPVDNLSMTTFKKLPNAAPINKKGINESRIIESKGLSIYCAHQWQLAAKAPGVQATSIQPDLLYRLLSSALPDNDSGL